TDLRDGLGPDVLSQFSNIQLKLSNGTVTSHLDIPSLRSFCSSQDVADFAKSLGEYIAEMDYAPIPISSNITTWFLLAVFIFVGLSGFIGNLLTVMVMLFFTFVLPVLFVIYCYIRILRTLNEATFNSFHLNAGSSIVRKHTSSSHTNSTLLNALTEENLPSTSNNSNNNTAGNNSDLNARDSFTRSSLRSQRAHKTVMKMLIMIAALFFVCYLPYHLERLIVKYSAKGCTEPQMCLWLYHGTGLLQYISAALNPIIYNVMSRRFRREFKLLCYRIVKKENVIKNRSDNNNHLKMTPMNRLL
uniref:G-protein coupled receptors family 1 profile domain-containing protein n=1 Tax=Meloidogyne javanica TaxID=6303 RepID=A0A915MNW5_MELJA